MPVAAVTDTLTLLAAGAGGVALFLRGLRGRHVRREGDPPRCRKCSCNLTDLTSTHCPECGATLSAHGVVCGVYRPRWLLLGGGAVLLGVCAWWLGVTVYQRARSIDVRAYLPFGWLLSGAQQDKGLDLYELMRRDRLGTLSVAQREQSVEAALVALAQSPPPAILRVWLEALNRWDAAGRLSPAQRARFYEQLRVLVTPTIHREVQITCGARWSGWLTHDALRVFDVYRTDFRFMANGTLLPISRGDWSDRLPVNRHDRDEFALSEVDLPPGRYQLQYSAQYEFYRPGEWLRRARGEDGFWRTNVTSAVDWEVLPPLNPGPIRLVSSPELDRQISAAIELVRLDAMHRNLDPESLVCVEFAFEATLPRDVAFDVWLRVGDQEVRMGRIAHSREAGASSRSLCANLEGYDEKDVLVVLRSDAAATRNSPGMVEIWGGELTLGPKRARRMAVLGNPP